jgi:iron complex transport system permease protein
MAAELFNRKNFVLYLPVLILLVTAFLFSLAVGKYPISVKEILDILLGKSVDPMTKNVFLTLRLPRTVMVMLAGFGLSIAGSVYQTIFKNPLASPDIIGVSSGASLGAAFAIVFLGGGMVAVAFSAFACGLIAVLFLLLLVGLANNKSIATYILSGIIINALTQALIMTLKFFADPERHLTSIEFWTMGSFGNITNEKVLIILPIFLTGLTGLLILRWQVILLSISDDEGRMLGVRVQYMRYGVLLCATLVVASVICVTGLISFIGLIAPHIARILLKKNIFLSSVLSGMVGAVILLAADCIARSISGSEVPISILTSLLGAPFLAYFMTRRERLHDGTYAT